MWYKKPVRLILDATLGNVRYSPRGGGPFGHCYFRLYPLSGCVSLVTCNLSALLGLSHLEFTSMALPEVTAYSPIKLLGQT
jgi:hypothetical protein